MDKLDIHGFPDAGEWAEELLKDGRALVLFDGLDEVRQEGNQRSKLSLLLKDFTRKV